MARAKNPHGIRGTINGVSFYVHPKFGEMARSPGGPDKEQMYTADAFATARENFTAFGKASTYAARLRDAFRSFTDDLKDSSYAERVQSRFTQILKKSDSCTMKAFSKNFHLLNGTIVCSGDKNLQVKYVSHAATESGIRVDLDIWAGKFESNYRRFLYIKGMMRSADLVNNIISKPSIAETPGVEISSYMSFKASLFFNKKFKTGYPFLCIRAVCDEPVNGFPSEVRDNLWRVGWLCWMR